MVSQWLAGSSAKTRGRACRNQSQAGRKPGSFGTFPIDKCVNKQSGRTAFRPCNAHELTCAIHYSCGLESKLNADLSFRSCCLVSNAVRMYISHMVGQFITAITVGSAIHNFALLCSFVTRMSVSLMYKRNPRTNLCLPSCSRPNS